MKMSLKLLVRGLRASTFLFLASYFLFLLGCGQKEEEQEITIVEEGHDEEETHLEHGEEDHEGETHAHKSPHGGVSRTVQDYHVEYVVRHEGVDVYLYDAKENPLSIEGMEGFISLQFPDGVMKKVDLNPILAADETSPNHLHAAIDLEEVESFKGLLSLNVGEERITLRFETEGEHAGHEEHGGER